MFEPTRVGVEINREPDETWHDVVRRYSKGRDISVACMAAFESYVDEGYEEPYAALRSLAECACTDVIIDTQHHKHTNNLQ